MKFCELFIGRGSFRKMLELEVGIGDQEFGFNRILAVWEARLKFPKTRYSAIPFLVVVGLSCDIKRFRRVGRVKFFFRATRKLQSNQRDKNKCEEFQRLFPLGSKDHFKAAWICR